MTEINEKTIYSGHHAKTDLKGSNENILVVGGTRSGKTLSIAFPQLLYLNDSSLIMTYSKWDDIVKYASLLIQRGYDIEYIDLKNAKRSSIGFDPMRYIQNAQDIKNIAHWIVSIAKDGTPGMDHYWDDCACDLLCAEMALVFTLYQMYEDGVYNDEMERIGILEYENNQPSFCDVLKIHELLKFHDVRGSSFTACNLDPLLLAIEGWADENEQECQALKWFNSVRGLAAKTVSCIYSTLTVILDKIFTPTIREVMEIKILNRKTSLNIESIGVKKTALFIYTSPVERSNDYFASLLYSILFCRLLSFGEKNGGRLDVPVKIICDDFAVGSQIPDFARTISFMCSFGISVIILLQSLSQLYGRYGINDGKTIMNNCDTMIYLGGMDIETCRDISVRVNQPLEDVLYMPLGKLYLIQRGIGWQLDDRYDIYHDEIYEKYIKNFK